MNNIQVRNTNKKKVVNFLYKNDGATKQDIISGLGLSAPTVSLIMKDLYSRGLVKKAGTLESSGGRKPTANSLVYDAKLSLGIEITNNHLRFVVIDLGANILYSKRIHERFCADESYFRSLAEHIDAFLDENGVEKEKLLGAGIAVPGIVNTQKNVLEYSPTLDVAHLPLDYITKYIPFPVIVDNEANLAGFSEIWDMEDVEDAVYLSINKGVGGAIIVGNKLFYGLDGRSGEFGHMTIVKDGLTCSCGKKGCFEAYCSTRMLTEPSFDDIDEFFSALAAQKTGCGEKWRTYLDYLAVGINDIYTIFNSNIIIGGEISRYIKEDSGVLKKRLITLSTFETRADYLHFSQFGSNASSIGAALIFVDSFLNE